MKSVRLLPVVIFAALALLVFKGIGLISNGAYVLTGTEQAQAAGGGHDAPAAEEGGEVAHGEAEGEAPATKMTMPSETVLTDGAPTLEDAAPTMATKAEGSGHGSGDEEEGHGSSEAGHDASTAEAGHEAPSSSVEHTPLVACPIGDEDHSGGDAAAEGHGEPAAEDHGSSAAAEGDHASTVPAADEHGSADEIPPADCVSAAELLNAYGDALPTTRDEHGNIVTLSDAEGTDSEKALVARLTERRAQLDALEAELDMRTSLVEAAEKRLDERAKELAALEARVAALVDEKQAAEDEGFKGIVGMYEAMKPKDAAKIFDTLELPVLLKLARAMNPRKMSPILALMSPKPAEALTTAFAATDNTDVVPASGENLAKLPQIVGQ